MMTILSIVILIKNEHNNIKTNKINNYKRKKSLILKRLKSIYKKNKSNTLIMCYLIKRNKIPKQN